MNFKQTSFSSFFPLPKSIFHIGLGAEEIAVYAYLMYCEDRETYQCYPSYSTIGEAVGMSKNTVKKYVDELRKNGLVKTKYTTVTTKDGRITVVCSIRSYRSSRLNKPIFRKGYGWKAQKRTSKHNLKNTKKPKKNHQERRLFMK